MRYVIKQKDRMGGWESLPGSDTTNEGFQTYQEALDYINNEILEKWFPGEETDPDFYDIF